MDERENKLIAAISKDLVTKLAETVLQESISSLKELSLPLSSKEEFEMYMSNAGIEIMWDSTVAAYSKMGIDLPIPFEVTQRVLNYLVIASTKDDAEELDSECDKAICDFFVKRSIFNLLSRIYSPKRQQN